MSRQDAGWWSLQTEQDLHNCEYSFVVDSQKPVPDPRSPSQPFGVHGVSKFVDHRRFQWSDGRWAVPLLRSGVIYELHIGTFTPEGTFDSAIERLDHLCRLGVTHVELMPVAEFPGDRGWGYDGVDLYAPHHVYGGPDGLKRLVNACHQRGLAVLLDVVYNHLGPDGNYLAQFGPYFSDRHKTPWGGALNLDGPGSSEVRRFLIDNALMWLRDYHFDGLRLDAVHAMFDTSAVHFLEQLAREVDELAGRLGRSLVLIAESDLNDPRVVQSWAVGGYGLTAQWSDDFHHAMHACLTGERHGYYSDFGDVKQVQKALASGFVYDGRFSQYRNRLHGRPLVHVAAHQLVVCLQNHDQIGNRAHGERNTHLMPHEGLLAGAAVLLLSHNVPLIFQGEEWGASTPFLYFTANENQELARSVSTGRKEEFSGFASWEDVPDPQARSTFERSKLDWTELARAPHCAVFDFYRSLIQLRQSMSGEALVSTEAPSTLRIERGAIQAFCNLDRHNPAIHLSAGGEAIFNSESLSKTGSIFPPQRESPQESGASA